MRGLLFRQHKMALSVSRTWHGSCRQAGVDFLYEHGHPVLSEVEDVVGSRMLYQVSSMDIAGLYLDQIRERL